MKFVSVMTYMCEVLLYRSQWFRLLMLIIVPVLLYLLFIVDKIWKVATYLNKNIDIETCSIACMRGPEIVIPMRTFILTGLRKHYTVMMTP